MKINHFFPESCSKGPRCDSASVARGMLSSCWSEVEVIPPNPQGPKVGEAWLPKGKERKGSWAGNRTYFRHEIISTFFTCEVKRFVDITQKIYVSDCTNGIISTPVVLLSSTWNEGHVPQRIQLRSRKDTQQIIFLVKPDLSSLPTVLHFGCFRKQLCTFSLAC